MAEPQTYGDPAVNEVIAYLLAVRDVPVLSGSDKENRGYAKKLLNLLHKHYPEADSVKMLKRLIDVSNCYHMYRTDPRMEPLWKNMGALIALSKEMRRVQKPKAAYKIENGLRKWD